MSRFRGKIGRFVALLALIAGLLGSVVMPAPGVAAAPVEPGDAHAAMDCDGMHQQTPDQTPGRRIPTGIDCCIGNVCAMNLALPAAPLGIALPAFFEPRAYDFQALRHPAGIDPAPLPHPPKSAA